MFILDDQDETKVEAVTPTVEETTTDAPAETTAEATEAPTTEEATTEAPAEAAATQEVVADKKEEKKPERKAGPRKLSINKTPMRRGRDTEFEERVIDIARVTKVVKGGRRFSFSALVVLGDKKGKIAWGHGKANEVPDAIRKAIKDAKTRLITVPIIDKRTVPHELQAKYLASTVLVKPAPKGKGIIASGAIRAVVELAGYKDIYTKSLGRSRSKTNSVKATIKALGELRTAAEVAKLRGIKVEDILG